MQFEEFKTSMRQDTPPAGLPPLLTALWHAGKGDWERAHTIAQDIPTREGSWVHAYLHRVEGDEGNAGYWYSRAGRKMPGVALEQEWADIVRAMLATAG
jgi:hypothetical protein